MNALHTRCPRCATVFRATPEHLAAAGGRVRCGSCEAVFDARANAVDPDALAPTPPPPGLMNAEYIDELLHEPGPDVAREPEPESAPAAQSDPPPDPGPLPTFPAIAPAAATPLVDLPIEIGAPRARSWLRQRMGWAVAVLAAALALFLQYAWLSRDRWAQDADLRPRVEAACAWLGCVMPPFRDPASIRSTELLVRPDPAREGVLLVDAVLFNRAPFAQEYPGLELSFTDIRGKAVARRVFGPREYLGAHPQPGALLAPREPVRVHLALKDPGEHATNYELRLITYDAEAAREAGGDR